QGGSCGGLLGWAFPAGSSGSCSAAPPHAATRRHARGTLLAHSFATLQWKTAQTGVFALSMNLLESLPTVIGTAAIAPALLILWLVVAAGERPGPPLKVWTAFALGAASILLLGLIRAPFANLFGAPANLWLAQAQHAVFGVAL